MPDTAKVIPIDRHDRPTEKARADTRRLVHEFATYCVWHLSLTKPNDTLAIRVLINDLLRNWLENEFTCGEYNCPYCAKESSIATRTGFRSMYRKLIGRKDMRNG